MRPRLLDLFCGAGGASMGTVEYVRPAGPYPGARPHLVVSPDSDTLPNAHAPNFDIEVPADCVTVIEIGDHG